MNYAYIISRLGLLFLVLSVIMLGMTGAYYGVQWVRGTMPEQSASFALLLSSVFGGVLGGGIWLTKRGGPRTMGRREAMLLVAMSWLLGAILAAMPYFLWAHLSSGLDAHPFRSYVNCYFESMSGLTTTGATILDNIEGVPRSLLLWRCMTQWLGGLGIIVLFVAVLPSLGVGAKKLYKMESTALNKDGVQPHIRDTARLLWIVYFAMTIMQIMAMRLVGADWYDSIAHTFSTVATGGFSPRNGSVGEFGTGIQIVIIIFMILGGINFALYYYIARGRGRLVRNDTELRFFLLLLLVGSLIAVASLYRAHDELLLSTGEYIPATLFECTREGVFQTVSILTTSGFATADFNHWPFLAQAVLIFFMFIGGSAGSTSGGIKVIRIWLVLKIMLSEIERVFRPQVVRPVRIAKGTIDTDLKLGTLAYVLGILVLFAIGSVVLMAIEKNNPHVDMDYTTAATASLATLCTIGPGLGHVGSVEHYGWFSAPSKIIMSLFMALGRLELFAIIVLFSPRFWRRD
jgi:trk system potassium uptake protein TrkH